MWLATSAYWHPASGASTLKRGNLHTATKARRSPGKRDLGLTFTGLLMDDSTSEGGEFNGTVLTGQICRQRATTDVFVFDSSRDSLVGGGAFLTGAVGLDTTTTHCSVLSLGGNSAPGRALWALPHTFGGWESVRGRILTLGTVLPDNVVRSGEFKLVRAYWADAGVGVGAATDLFMFRAEFSSMVRLLAASGGKTPSKSFAAASSTRDSSRGAARTFTVCFVAGQLACMRSTRKDPTAAPAGICEEGVHWFRGSHGQQPAGAVSSLFARGTLLCQMIGVIIA